MTVTFAEEGGKTRLTMRSVWPTPEALEAVRKFGAVEGGNQTLDRLAEHLVLLCHKHLALPDTAPHTRGTIRSGSLLARASRAPTWPASPLEPTNPSTL